MSKRTIAAERFRPLIIQALLLPVLAMIAFGAVLLWQVTRVLENQWWVDHTDQVLSDANDLHGFHLRAESAVRGYLLSGLPIFREQFQRERAELQGHSDVLEKIVSDNPPQVEAVRRISAMRNDWLALIDHEIDLHDHGGDWQKMISTGSARVLMGSINDAFRSFIGVEEGLRDRRTARMRQSFHVAIATTISLAVLIGLVLAVLARRQLRYLVQTYEQALHESNRAADVLEQRVAERTAELETANEKMKRAGEALAIANDRLKVSNRELQDFASVASHDLQEPLRKVQAFGDRLKAKSADALGPDGLDYLDRMLNAAARMKTLINDLLTFARVTSRAQPFEKVDLKLVVDQVLSDLESRIEQKNATIEVAPLPVIDADVTQMRQLFQNLIGNAMKFNKPGEGAHVEVDVADISDDRLQLRVRDHGIGFDLKYLDRIFTVFQRLHGRNEYEGTGIGLAVCRKIVERHRGTITAESRLGEGATFIVDLPKTQPDAGAVSCLGDGTRSNEELIEAASA